MIVLLILTIAFRSPAIIVFPLLPERTRRRFKRRKAHTQQASLRLRSSLSLQYIMTRQAGCYVIMLRESSDVN